MLFRYLLLAQHHLPARVTKDMASPVNVFRAVVAEGMAKREIPKGDPEVATAMAMSVVLQPAMARTRGRIQKPLAALAPTLSAAVWRALQG